MEEKTPEQWKAASQSFDKVAQEYDTFRPTYPRELVDGVVELACLPSSAKILEVGSGTGKATRLFAERGYSILCIEPGTQLATVASRGLKDFPQVQFQICRFEDWPVQAETFDCVLSAQAFHWVPKDTGYAKATQALKASGHLALFWNLYCGLKATIVSEIQEIYQEIAPSITSPVTNLEATIQLRMDEIAASHAFGPITVQRFPWTATYTSREYQGLLHTYSDHLALDVQTQQRLYQAIGEAIDRHGGRIERPYEAVLFVAQKRSSL